MSEHLKVEVLRTGLEEHPATRAWSQLHHGTIACQTIEVLKPPKRRSAVYRLRCVGTHNIAVIAKRCQPGTAMVERTIYEDILPHVAIPALRYYGCVREPDGEFEWLFLEDAGEECYSKGNPGHAVLAAQWLGLLHTSTEHLSAVATLPDASPTRYQECLGGARNRISSYLHNPVLTSDDRALLGRILEHLDMIEAHWDRIEQSCDRMPRTLVHGDFIKKNVRVRPALDGAIILPFDWECAGWGVPAVDLEGFAFDPLDPALASYLSTVRDTWPGIDSESLKQWANIGRILRLVASVEWASTELRYEWAENGMIQMRVYQPRMVAAMQEAGLTREACVPLRGSKPRSDTLCFAKHPSILAWERLHGESPTFTKIETLQEDRTRFVYRIHDFGPTNSSIIVKRCPVEQAQRERLAYQEVLPRLPVKGLKLHGFCVEEAGAYAWLFLEEALGEPYTPFNPAHRRFVGRWLGQVHACASTIPDPSNLRDSGPDHFRRYLKPACQTISRSLTNSALSDDDRRVLKAIISQLRVLESHWGQLERFCERMPRTFVHGDLKEDQMLVRSRPVNGYVLVFDYGESGWGVPALDVAKFLGYSVAPDIGAYLSAVHEKWPFLNIQTVHRLGHVGEIFRCLASIRWEADGLHYEWVVKPMSTMVVYKEWMDDELRAAPWDDKVWSSTRIAVPKLRGWH